jgi:hypothetical protein
MKYVRNSKITAVLLKDWAQGIFSN